MKSLLVKMVLMLGVVFTMASCDKDEERIAIDELPAVSQSFISQYFANAKITSTIKDKESAARVEYEVKLDNGVAITFDEAGNWLDVEARNDREALPSTGFILPAIVSYVTNNYPSVGINGIEREMNGFDIELTNDIDLVFNSEGGFVREDR